MECSEPYQSWAGGFEESNDAPKCHRTCPQRPQNGEVCLEVFAKNCFRQNEFSAKRGAWLCAAEIVTGKMANSNKKNTRVCCAHISAAKRLNTSTSNAETLYRAALSLFLSVVAMFRRLFLLFYFLCDTHWAIVWRASRAFAQQPAIARINREIGPQH